MNELQIQIIETSMHRRGQLFGRERSRIVELNAMDRHAKPSPFDVALLENLGKRFGLIPMTDSEAALERQIQQNSRRRWRKR